LGKQDQIWAKIFCIPKNMPSRTLVTVLHAVTCLLGCLPRHELSTDNNQPSTTRFGLLRHDYSKVLTNIDLCIHSDTKAACV